MIPVYRIILCCILLFQKRKNEPGKFTASVESVNSGIDTEFPEKFRPRNHSDWTTC